jgi:hypothetical protein
MDNIEQVNEKENIKESVGWWPQEKVSSQDSYIKMKNNIQIAMFKILGLNDDNCAEFIEAYSSKIRKIIDEANSESGELVDGVDKELKSIVGGLTNMEMDDDARGLLYDRAAQIIIEKLNSSAESQ